MQQGRYAAEAIAGRLAGRAPAPFRYKDKGALATIGRASAVADLGWLRLSGLPAWLAWLFIHILYLIEFENRVLVMVQWASNYFTRNRSARLITGAGPGPASGGRELAAPANRQRQLPGQALPGS
jgi:NADH dehydrogenase